MTPVTGAAGASGPRLYPRLTLLVMALAHLTALTILAQAEPRTWATIDGADWHLPQVAYFTEHGPSLVYPAKSATGPLYHWVAASYHQWLPGTEPLSFVRLRGLNLAIFGLYLLTCLALFTRLSGDRMTGALLVLVAAGTPYLGLAALYPVTEGLTALLFALFFLGLFYPGPGGTWLQVMGAPLLTLCRQSYWPLTCLTLLGVKPGQPAAVLARRIVPFLLSSLAMLTMYLAWGGLTPPRFQNIHAQQSALPLLPLIGTLAFIGIAGLAVTLPCWRRLLESKRLLMLGLALALGAVIFLDALPHPAESMADSIVWRVAKLSRDWLGFSVLIVPLLLNGLLTLFTLLRLGPGALETRYEGWGLVLFSLSSMASPFAYQRYIEPITFFLLATFLARTRPGMNRLLLTCSAFTAYSCASYLFYVLR